MRAGEINAIIYTNRGVMEIDEKIIGAQGETSAQEKNEQLKEIDEALKNFETSEAEAEAKAEAEVKDEEPKKRRWILNVFLVGIIALGVVLMFRIMSEFNETHKSLWDILYDTDALFAILTLSALVVILVAETMKYSVIFRAVTGKFHILTSLRTMFLGKYYDNITPFSTGGQPMQIYYLCRKGFYGGISGAIIMIKYFANTFIWVIIAGVLMALKSSALDGLGGGVALKVFAWIGWGINMLIPASVVLFVILPKFAYALAKGVVFIGEKMKIVKDKEQALAKATKVVTDFKASFQIMIKRPKMLALLLLLCVVEISLTFAFPYFVVKTFAGGELGIAETGIGTVLTVMALNAFTAFAVSMVPTPGNSGVWEGASSLAFRAIASSAWVLFMWRFFVYYIYIIIGFGITVYEFIKILCQRKKITSKGQRIKK